MTSIRASWAAPSYDMEYEDASNHEARRSAFARGVLP